MLCKFGDSDTEHPIGSYTVLEHRSVAEVLYKTKRGPFYTGEHVTSGDIIKIFKKKDRGAILAITEGKANKQILQVKMKSFGLDEVIAFSPALEFAKGIAMKYVAGEISKEQLISYRDEALTAMGMSGEARGRPPTIEGPSTGQAKHKARAKSGAASPKACATKTKAGPAAKAIAKATAKAPTSATGSQAGAKPSAGPVAKSKQAQELLAPAPSTPPAKKKFKLPSFAEPPSSTDEVLASFACDV